MSGLERALAAALHAAKVDCNPFLRMDGLVHPDDPRKHMALHGDASAAILAEPAFRAALTAELAAALRDSGAIVQFVEPPWPQNDRDVERIVARLLAAP